MNHFIVLSLLVAALFGVSMSAVTDLRSDAAFKTALKSSQTTLVFIYDAKFYCIQVQGRQKAAKVFFSYSSLI